MHLPQRDLRQVVKVSRDEKGALQVTMFFNIDQSGQSVKSTGASFEGGELKYAIQMLDADFDGKLAGDHNSIEGTLHMGQNSMPLLLVRATPATEWALPAPPAKIPAMAASANPSFDVATIKPSDPSSQAKYLTVRGTDVIGMGMTLRDLITIAYDMQDKQIVGGPDWMHTDKFDLDGKPDAPGVPSRTQIEGMLQKLLADRFELKYHKETREMQAYVLLVAKGGPKMTKSDAPADALPGLGFRGLGILPGTNATMGDLAEVMQMAVLDRPVVDQTGLTGRWNFLLKWTPDETQFAALGVKVPPPSEAADAPPPLFTAIQDQLGLRLDAGKAQVPVMVLDSVQKPSAN